MLRHLSDPYFHPSVNLPGTKFSGFKWVEKKESDELLGRVNSPWVNPRGECGWDCH